MFLHKYFLNALLKNSPYIIMGILLLLAVDYAQLAIPIEIGDIINAFKTNQGNTTVISTSVLPHIYTLLIIVSYICLGRIIWRFHIFGGSRAIEKDIRDRMFIHATNLSQNYYGKNKVGALMSLFTADIEAVRMAYGPGVMQLVDGTFLMGMIIYRMIKINAQLTLMAFLPLSFVLILMIVYKQSLKSYFGIKQKALENMSNFIQESYSGIQIVKAHVKEMFELKRFKEKKLDLYQKAVKYATTLRRFLTLLTVVGVTAFIIVIAYSSYIVSLGWLNPGEVVTYLTYFITLTWPMNALGSYLSTITQASASAKRIIGFLKQPIDMVDKNNILPNPVLDGSIKVNNLSFAYPDCPERLILKNVSFEIKDGERVGILGKTGSGKTTMMELLLRLYNVDANQLFIGGYDVVKIPIKSVRNIIGYVPQDNFLFSTSIKNNIAFANQKMSEMSVLEAAKISAVYDNIINFTDGFNTILGERGVTISGGQKQRISIARAIAKRPQILVLDDSVSAVDTETENTILQNLNITKKTTTIFIAHRISTVKNLDRIIIFNEGQIEAIGTHDELSKSSPYYQALITKQELENEAKIYG